MVYIFFGNKSKSFDCQLPLSFSCIANFGHAHYRPWFRNSWYNSMKYSISKISYVKCKRNKSQEYNYHKTTNIFIKYTASLSLWRQSSCVVAGNLLRHWDRQYLKRRLIQINFVAWNELSFNVKWNINNRNAIRKHL